MKRKIFALACALSAILATNGLADDLRQPLSVRPITFNYDYYLQDEAPAAAPAAAPSVQEAITETPAAPTYNAAPMVSAGCATGCATPACNAGCGPVACDSGCGGGCSSCCDSGCGLDLGGDWCCLGDAWTISDKLLCDCSPWSVGGWFQTGYHTENTGLFNSRPDDFQLHQAWMYAERAITAECGVDWGFRADFMYGTDSQDTQAFGNEPNAAGDLGWDNEWDNGNDYGFALPQLYAEFGNTDFSVKVGHFYTIIGWEVVTAPDNFFYSHAITMYNSEPFTHTGILATKSVGDNATVWAGWTLGWDTGFDQFGDGSNFLGGVSYAFSDSVTGIYATTIGDFGARGSDGYMHSFILDVAVTDNLQYIFQNDVLRVDSTGEDIFDINQYFIYSINDCLAVGQRIEWWKLDGTSFYEATTGVNIRPHANVILRPEIRTDWVPALDVSQTGFGIDAIFTF